MLRRPTSLALALRPLRLLHSSVSTANYVGPPDPVSNIRPVLYNDLGSTSAESPQHPYSLDEFRNDSDTLEYQWKLQRQQLDAFNDAFWRDVRFSHRCTPPPVSRGHIIISSHVDEHPLRSGQGSRSKRSSITRNRRTPRRASRTIL